MWVGNLLPFDRFQTKKNNYNYARGQFTTFWQIPDKKNIQLCERAIYYLLTDSRKKNYNYARGQITTYWQIPDKKIITIMWEGNLLPFDRFQTKKINYNYVRGQFTTFWQIPDKKKK